MRIKDICDINMSTISRRDKSKQIEYLDTSSITENVISNTQKLVLSEAPSRAQRKVKKNTIIYSLVRPNLKHFGILQDPPDNFIVSTGFCTLDIKDEWIGVIDPYYLFLFLSTDSITQYLSTIAENSVSSYPSINPSDIENLEIELPLYKEQLLISNIFKEIDSKLANNRKQNAILEKMVKQIYDYWFVQFDFPDENGRPYKSSGGKMVWEETLKREVPIGWEVKKIGDCVSDCGRATTPGEHLHNLPYCPIDEIPIREMTFCGGKSYTDAKSSLQLYEENNILIGAMRVYFHRCSIASEKGITRTTTIVLKPYVESFFSYYYQVLNEDRAFDFAIKVSTGTQQPYVTWKALSNYIFPFPIDETVIALYCDRVNPMIEKAKNNAKEYHLLLLLRDELLPVLMNGQVSIKGD